MTFSSFSSSTHTREREREREERIIIQVFLKTFHVQSTTGKAQRQDLNSRLFAFCRPYSFYKIILSSLHQTSQMEGETITKFYSPLTSSPFLTNFPQNDNSDCSPTGHRFLECSLDIQNLDFLQTRPFFLIHTDHPASGQCHQPLVSLSWSTASLQDELKTRMVKAKTTHSRRADGRSRGLLLAPLQIRESACTVEKNGDTIYPLDCMSRDGVQ